MLLHQEHGRFPLRVAVRVTTEVCSLVLALERTTKLNLNTGACCRWLKELGRELEERVAVDRAENAREPKLLTVHAGNISRSGPLRRPTADCIAEDSLALVGVPLLHPASLLKPSSQGGEAEQHMRAAYV